MCPHAARTSASRPIQIGVALPATSTEGKEAMSRRTLVAIAAGATALLVAGGAQSQGSATKLSGTVGSGFTIKLTKGGKKFASLKAGKYSFAITDKSSIHDFTLE